MDIVHTLHEQFPGAPAHYLTVFERRVLSCRESEAEADVVLTTVHQAKGLEWDRVQVLGDFVSLAN